jgi:type III pantothenate kinase
VILLLDAGNSRLKWGCYTGGQLAVGDPVAYAGSRLESNLERALGAIAPPTRVLMCSVAAAATQRRLTRWLRNRWHAPLAGVVPGRRGCGVQNAYPQPGTLGADRWAALVGARAAGAGATCIVDAGTAVTVDLLTADGVHAGGLIVPGLELARSSLDRRTGRIAATAGADGDGGHGLQLAHNTRDAVRTGTLYQLVALLDRVVDDLAAAASGPLRGLLTGGDAVTLLPLLRTPFEHRPHLVLEGLAELARKRCNQQPVPD